MEYYLNIVLPAEKSRIETEKQNEEIFSLEKEVIKVIEENNNFPKELPKPIQLKDLTKYYGIKWKKNLQKINKENI